MNELIIYFLKVSIALTLFYGLHMFFFREETLFNAKRIYFFVAFGFSLLFPFLNFSLSPDTASALVMPTYWLSDIEIMADNTGTLTSSTDLDIFRVLFLAGVLGSVLLFCRFVFQLVSLFFQLRKMNCQHVDGYLLIDGGESDVQSFSFFKWIIVNVTNKTDSQVADIIRHEQVHVQQIHSLDVMLFELLCICMWWNPIVWLLKKEVKLNLEFLADEGVLYDKKDNKEYQYLLLRVSIGNTGMTILNNFNISELQKRISMMNKKRTSKMWSVKFLLTVPLALVLVLGNVVQASPNLSNDSERMEISKVSQEPIFTVVEQMPVYPGGETELIKFVVDNLKYPLEAQKNGVQGRIVVKFVVTKDGTLTNVVPLRKDASITNAEAIDSEKDEVVVVGYNEPNDKVVKSIDTDAVNLLAEEAIRVVEAMPNWEPGMQNGKKVDVYYVLPIVFRLR